MIVHRIEVREIEFAEVLAALGLVELPNAYERDGQRELLQKGIAKWIARANRRLERQR